MVCNFLSTWEVSVVAQPLLVISTWLIIPCEVISGVFHIVTLVPSGIAFTALHDNCCWLAADVDDCCTWLAVEVQDCCTWLSAEVDDCWTWLAVEVADSCASLATEIDDWTTWWAVKDDNCSAWLATEDDDCSAWLDDFFTSLSRPSGSCSISWSKIIFIKNLLLLMSIGGQYDGQVDLSRYLILHKSWHKPLIE